MTRRKLFSMTHSSFFLDFYDPDHSVDEDRYIIIGESVENQILVVSYTEREESIRLISAREATRREKDAYKEG